MKNQFSKSWISSKSPRKQRKYRYNAPLHLRKKLVSAHLSKEIRKEYKTRSAQLRKGDSVRVARGQHKGKTGKVDEVSIKKLRVYVEGIEIVKKEGTKIRIPLRPSNLIITELNTDDAKRKIMRMKRDQNE